MLSSSVSIETTEGISLEAIIGCANVGIVCHHEMVLAHLVSYLGDHRAVVALGELREVGSLEEIFVALDGDHIVELRSKCHAHLADLTLAQV